MATYKPSTYRSGQSIFSGIANLFSGLWRRTKDADGIGYWIQTRNDGYSYELGEIKNFVEKGFVVNPNIYAVINKILMESRNIPWYQYRIKSRVSYKQYRNFIDAGDFDKAFEIRNKAVDIIEDSKSDLQKLLDRPNPRQSFQQFNETNLGMLLLTGDAMPYAVKSPLESRKGILEWIPLPPQCVKVIPKNWYGEVEKYLLFIDPSNGIPFDPSEICHIKNFNPLNAAYMDQKTVFSLSVRGLSPAAALGNVIQNSNDGYIAQMRLIQNGGPIGILSNASNEPMVMPEGESADSQVNNLLGYTGAENRGKIKVTTANLKWIDMGMNSVDLQLLDLQKATLSTVCNVYGMPLEMMSMEGSTFNNKKESLKEMWNGAILPWMNMLRDGYNEYLKNFYPEVKNGSVYIDYDHRAIPALQQDMDKMHKIWLERVQNHIATPSMYHEAMGMDGVVPDENLDKYFTVTNLRRSDEPLPGRTDVNNNGNNTDTSGN